MWYGMICNGKEFYSKIKPITWERNPNHIYFTAKTKKELFSKFNQIQKG